MACNGVNITLLKISKGKGVSFLETLVSIYGTGRRYIREDSNLATSGFLRDPETPYIQKQRSVHTIQLLEVTGDTKKRELLKNPTKIEEIQEKTSIDRN